MSNSAIQDALNKAKEASQNQPEHSHAVAVQQHGGAVSTAVSRPATLDTLLAAGGMNVDGWLKVKSYGLLIDDNKNFIKTIKVAIDTTNINTFYGVRFGNPATYYKSFDGVQCVQGGSWDAAVERAKRADPKCTGEYVGADLEMTLLEDVKAPDGTVIMAAGKTLGHSTSITGTKPVAALVKEFKGTPMDGKTLAVEVGVTVRSKPGVEDWGILSFKILGEFSDPEPVDSDNE